MPKITVTQYELERICAGLSMLIVEHGLLLTKTPSELMTPDLRNAILSGKRGCLQTWEKMVAVRDRSA